MPRPKLWLRLPPTKTFLAEIGLVVTQWAYFEQEFDETIHFLRADPRGKALEDPVPYAFKRRLKLFRALTKITFPQCEPLLARMKIIADDAKKLKKQRDYISHCRWLESKKKLFGWTPDQTEMPKTEITEDFLYHLAYEISGLSRRIQAILRAGTSDFSFPLTSPEISAIQDFRSKNLPMPPIQDIYAYQPRPSQK